MPYDLEKLQGTWHITALEVDGQREGSAAFDGAMIVIDEDRFTSVSMGFTFEGTFEIDESKNPKTLDMVFTAGHATGVRNLGIYRLSGERWTLCLATRGSKRPDEFATAPNTGLALETLERSVGRKSARGKSRAQSRAPARTETPPATPGDTHLGKPSKLEGDWAMVAGVFSGAPMAKSMADLTERVTRGKLTTVLAGGSHVMMKATFTIDESKTPHTIDYVNLEGTNRGKAQAGIFELNGDSLEVCMSPPGKPRPAEFSSNPKDGRSYTTWRRKNG